MLRVLLQRSQPRRRFSRSSAQGVARSACRGASLRRPSAPAEAIAEIAEIAEIVEIVEIVEIADEAETADLVPRATVDPAAVVLVVKVAEAEGLVTARPRAAADPQGRPSRPSTVTPCSRR